MQIFIKIFGLGLLGSAFTNVSTFLYLRIQGPSSLSDKRLCVFVYFRCMVKESGMVRLIEALISMGKLIAR